MTVKTQSFRKRGRSVIFLSVYVGCSLLGWQPGLLVKQLACLLHSQKVAGSCLTPPALLCEIYYSEIYFNTMTDHRPYFLLWIQWIFLQSTSNSLCFNFSETNPGLSRVWIYVQMANTNRKRTNNKGPKYHYKFINQRNNKKLSIQSWYEVRSWGQNRSRIHLCCIYM